MSVGRRSLPRLAVAPSPMPLLVGVVALILVVLGLDSAWLGPLIPGSRWLAVGLTVAAFLGLLLSASPRLQRLMLVGLAIATVGELVLSQGLGMYEYRLGDLPLYVPFGHTILYATIFHFERGLRRWPRANIVMAALILIHALGMLALLGDRFGFVCFLAYLVVLAFAGPARRFFLAMYLLVAFMEAVGTLFGCWAWPGLAFGVFEHLPSANPPSGIPILYAIFDSLCLAAILALDRPLRQRLRGFRRDDRTEVHALVAEDDSSATEPSSIPASTNS